jgi:general secretion pathway protein A
VIEDRIAELEARVELQDKALRRVLTLLVDWVESDADKPEYAPIRGVATWHDAA